MLALFVACALLPIGLLAVYSYTHVNRQLSDESRVRVRQSSKGLAMTLVERLQLAEADLGNVAATLGKLPTAAMREGALSELSEPFTGLIVVSGTGASTDLIGHVRAPPRLTAQELRHLSSGRSILGTDASAAQPAVILGRAMDPRHLSRGILWAELSPEYLWRGGVATDVLPPATELCVFDQLTRPLYCSLPVAAGVLDGLRPALTRAPGGNFEWRDPRERETYVAGYWSLPLRFTYLTPYWTVVLSESKANVLAPLANFKRTFPLTILLVLLAVLLLSNTQIRRSLDPLDKLQQGTQRIARRDFGTPVKVESGDEFQDLATSFNAMALRVERQFHALMAFNDIDRAVLSALDTERIIDSLLHRAGDALGCDTVSVSLARADDADAAWTLRALVTPAGEKLVREIRPTQQERQELEAHPDYFPVDARERSRGYLDLAPSSSASDVRSFLVLPIFLREELSGVIALGYGSARAWAEEDLVQARQLADQVAVALSNARLLEELNQLNWGTLTALARTIDANSPWTAGHSERVSQLALAIGRQLGLTSDQLGHLHRGGLLHDIGKLAIPAAILDKPGPLTAEETRVMREHVRIGARILAPIKAYGEAISVVLHHHERFDGSGYPDGLAGEAIPLLARIFAVADCYDALTVDRPYRRGVRPPEAVAVILQEAGTNYDPRVVTAFLAVIGAERPTRQDPAMAAAPSTMRGSR